MSLRDYGAGHLSICRMRRRRSAESIMLSRGFTASSGIGIYQKLRIWLCSVCGIRRGISDVLSCVSTFDALQNRRVQARE